MVGAGFSSEEAPDGAAKAAAEGLLGHTDLIEAPFSHPSLALLLLTALTGRFALFLRHTCVCCL